MKLTKATLKQLIAEVMKEEEERISSDLRPAMVLLQSGLINSTVKYAQLVKMVLGYQNEKAEGLDKSLALKAAVGGDTALAGKIMQAFGEAPGKPDVAPPTGVAGDKAV